MSVERVDVAVIGGGPAGIAAAARAAESGRMVAVFDESARPGGNIWRHRERASLPADARSWLQRLERSGADVQGETSVVDVRTHGSGRMLTLERAGGAASIAAGAVIIATGARERFLPFPGWTLPGVIGVGGAQALLKAGTSFAGKRVVIAGSGPLLLPVAAALRQHGARVVRVSEQAESARVMGFGLGLITRPATMLQAARYRAAFAGTPYRFGEWVRAARGEGRVEEVVVGNGRVEHTIACDVLCAAFGLVANTELARLMGCALGSAGVSVDEYQQTTIAGVYCVGETTGIGGVDLAIVEGEIAGLHASGSPVPASLTARRASLGAMAAAMERAFAPRDELRRLATPDTIVCRCEDVTAGAIDPAWTSRQAKLYTRAGMGPCQGRVCGAAFEFLHGWTPDVVRVPTAPALFATLSSKHSDPSTHE